MIKEDAKHDYDSTVATAAPVRSTEVTCEACTDVAVTEMKLEQQRGQFELERQTGQ